MKNIIFLLLAIATLTSCSKGSGNIKGNVYWKCNDLIGNKPDAGSEIIIWRLDNYSQHISDYKLETTTDMSGNYVFENVPVGSYILLVKSNNTNMSNPDTYKQIVIFKNHLEMYFNLDISSLKDDLKKLSELDEKYLDAVLETPDFSNKNGEDYFIKTKSIQKELETLAENIFDKSPEGLIDLLGLQPYYTNKFEFDILEVEKDKTVQKNTYFGITFR